MPATLRRKIGSIIAGVPLEQMGDVGLLAEAEWNREQAQICRDKAAKSGSQPWAAKMRAAANAYEHAADHAEETATGRPHE